MTDTRIPEVDAIVDLTVADAVAPTIPAAPTSPVTASLVPASPVPASPVPVGRRTADGVEDSDLGRLLTAFRLMQMQHARVLHHESVARGLNATDSRFVFFLAAADGEGVTPKQSGEYLELSTGAMTSLIDRLEKRGHIERRPNPDDRRSILIHLTASGAAVAQQIGALYAAAFREVTTPGERQPLADALAGLGDALERRSGVRAGASA